MIGGITSLFGFALSVKLWNNYFKIIKMSSQNNNFTIIKLSAWNNNFIMIICSLDLFNSFIKWF